MITKRKPSGDVALEAALLFATLEFQIEIGSSLAVLEESQPKSACRHPLSSIPCLHPRKKREYERAGARDPGAAEETGDGVLEVDGADISGGVYSASPDAGSFLVESLLVLCR